MDPRGTTHWSGDFDYACVTYHFAAQHFGALSLYRARAERGRCIQTRRLDRFFALTVGGVLVFVADILAGAVAYQDHWVDRWFPAWIVSAENGIRGGAMLALFAITAIILVAELRTPRWSLPRILYIVGLAVMVGLALRPRSLFLFLVIWTSQHWILATGLGSQTPRAEPTPASGVVRGVLHGLNIRPWAIVLFLMMVSVALLPLFEVEGNRETGTVYYGDRIFGAIATQLRTSPWVLHCWLWVSRRALFITCSIEVFIECRIRKCARQRLAWLATRARFPEGNVSHHKEIVARHRCPPVCQAVQLMCAGSLRKHRRAHNGKREYRHSKSECDDTHPALLELSRRTGEEKYCGKQNSVREVLPGNVAGVARCLQALAALALVSAASRVPRTS